MKKSKMVHRIPQTKLMEFYRLTVQMIGFEIRRVEMRDWFIRHRKRPVQQGNFRLQVIPVPTAVVDLKKFERRMNRLPKRTMNRVLRMLKGCVVKDRTFRVEVKPIR